MVEGNAYIQSTFNNTIVTLTDLNGEVISLVEFGRRLQGDQRDPFAAQLAAETAARRSSDQGMKRVHIYVKGPGSGRETAIRAIGTTGISVVSIKDITAVPHNGCGPETATRLRRSRLCGCHSHLQRV